MFYEMGGDRSNYFEREEEKIRDKYNRLISETNSPSVARKLMNDRDAELRKLKA